MKKILLASAATLFLLTGTSFAASPAADNTVGLSKTTISIDNLVAARSKKRVPGGSGCDTPRDLAEHPECRPNADATSPVDQLQEDQFAARSKKRVPGGSGCDTPQDRAEHPECTAARAGVSTDQLPQLLQDTDTQEAKRRKPRVRGGSGCDDPRDLIEHPECRPAA
jgi:hypothetical protein